VIEHSRFKLFHRKPAAERGMALLAMLILSCIVIIAVTLSIHLAASHSRQQYREGSAKSISTIINLALNKAAETPDLQPDSDLESFLNDGTLPNLQYLHDTAKQAGYLLENANIHINNNSTDTFICPNIQDIQLSTNCSDTSPDSDYCYFQASLPASSSPDGKNWVGVKYVYKQNMYYATYGRTNGSAILPSSANILNFQPPGVSPPSTTTFLSCHATVQDTLGRNGYIIMWPQDPLPSSDTQCHFSGATDMTPNQQNNPITCNSATQTCKLICSPPPVTQYLHQLTFLFPIDYFSDKKNVLNTIMSQLDISKVANYTITSTPGGLKVNVWIYGGGSPI